LSHQERLISDLDLHRQPNVQVRLEYWAPNVGRKPPLPRRVARERDWRAHPATLSARQARAFDHLRYRRPASIMYAAMSTQNA
jgi:hypothetical protein